MLGFVMSEQRTIGVIAGSGIYPETFIRAARKQGVRIVVAAFKGETKEALAEEVDEIKWFRGGQLGGVIKFLRKQVASEAIMVGQIAPRNLFDLWPDLRTLKVLHSVKERNAETLFGAIADELAKDGITLLPATTFLEDQMAGEGHLYGPKPSDRDWEDIRFGQKIVKRGGKLGKGTDVTLVKVSKPNQDMRFDVPVIGPRTIKSCCEAGVGTIAVEAGKTLFLGLEEIEARCREGKVAIVGFS